MIAWKFELSTKKRINGLKLMAMMDPKKMKMKINNFLYRVERGGRN
jgi:hypothetical protein